MAVALATCIPLLYGMSSRGEGFIVSNKLYLEKESVSEGIQGRRLTTHCMLSRHGLDTGRRG